jgi:putative transposase
MIDQAHALPFVRQCQLLGLSRSTAYYQPRPVSATNLALMRRIDELHLDHPFAGARMLRDLLRREGHTIGRKRVCILMTRMGIHAVYCKPRTSHRHPAHTVYPYLLRHLKEKGPRKFGQCGKW